MGTDTKSENNYERRDFLPKRGNIDSFYNIKH